MPAVTALLPDRVGADPAGPLLTYYDDVTGERVELSAATADNWVAKSANLLVDGLGLGPGDRVSVQLPLHWQTAVALLAVWAAGGVAVAGPDAGAAAVLAGEDALDGPAAAGEGVEVVGLSLRPLGGRLAGSWPGVTDYAAEVLGYGDRFAGPTPGPDVPAMVLAGRTYRSGELAALAAAVPLTPGDRVLTVVAPLDPVGLVAGLLAPLAAGAGIVQCRRLDPSRLPARVTAERVTATVGVSVPGVRELRLR
jgi:uncharacterized protein (TIGR03089 family)